MWWEGQNVSKLNLSQTKTEIKSKPIFILSDIFVCSEESYSINQSRIMYISDHEHNRNIYEALKTRALHSFQTITNVAEGFTPLNSSKCCVLCMIILISILVPFYILRCQI